MEFRCRGGKRRRKKMRTGDFCDASALPVANHQQIRARIALGEMIVPIPFAPPPIPSRDVIRQILVDRVDTRRLSVGMIVGLTESGKHCFAAYGGRDVIAGSP
jgi:hypothetical protein